MNSEESILDIIRKRRSKRNYINKDFSSSELEDINKLLQKNTIGPFGNKVSFNLVEKEFATQNHKVKLGTYGFISGAKYFIVSLVLDGTHIYEDTGYLLEKVILDLTKINLATCWMGGTFKRSDFSIVLELEDDIKIPAVTPVGHPTPSLSVKDKIIRMGAKSDSRKEWSELFYNNSFEESLTKEDALIYFEPLEMLRLAPSASNKQPWRILKTKDAFHFYLKRTPGYNKSFINADLQKVDMGIAMSHFELACKELALKGLWISSNPSISSEKVDEYIISWKIS